MDTSEIVFVVLSIIAGIVSFINTVVANRRINNIEKKSNTNNDKLANNLKKLCYALGIVDEDETKIEIKEEREEREPIEPAEPYENMHTPSDNSSNVQIMVKYNPKTGDIILPSDFELKE